MNDNHIRVSGASTAGTPDSACRGHARPSVRARMTARLPAARFDRALAVGVPAPAGSALAAHAARLTSVAERQTVARALRRAVRDAKDTRATQTGRVPMHRANIASAEALIDEVRLRLHMPHPVSARGMARLRQLLSDGTGPSTGTAVATSRVVCARYSQRSDRNRSPPPRSAADRLVRAVTPQGIQHFRRPGTGFGSRFR